MQKRSTGMWTGYFQSLDDAEQKLGAWLDMHRKPANLCTFPATDRTFPTNQDEMIALVRRVFEAISDWREYQEWTQTVDVDVKDQFVDNLLAERAQVSGGSIRNDHHDLALLNNVSMEDLRPRQEELMRMLPPLKQQQKKVLGRDAADITFEWLSWLLVVRCPLR